MFNMNMLMTIGDLFNESKTKLKIELICWIIYTSAASIAFFLTPTTDLFDLVFWAIIFSIGISCVRWTWKRL